MGLTNKERYTYDIINKVITSNLTRKEAMFELNKSRQQIYRLINIYCTKGEKGLIHGNRKKVPYNKKESFNDW